MTSRMPDIECIWCTHPFFHFVFCQQSRYPSNTLRSNFSFSVKIGCIVDMVKSNDFEMSLTVILLSSCTAWRISSIMASPISVCLKGLSSSSIDARPSRNLLCYLNTIDLETCTPSSAMYIICSVSVGDFSRLEQNLITAHFSKLLFFALILEDAISVNYHCTRFTVPDWFKTFILWHQIIVLRHIWFSCNFAHFMMVKKTK